MLDMTPEEKAIAEREANKQQAELDFTANLFASTFSTEAGKKVLKHLEVVCNAHNSTVKNKSEPNTNSVMFEEGKRMVYEYIVYYLRYSHERRSNQSK